MKDSKIAFYAYSDVKGLHIINPFTEIVIPLRHLPKMTRLMMDGSNFSYDSANDILIDETERYLRFLDRLDEIRKTGAWPNTES